MTVLSNLTQAQIAASVTTITGKTLSRPALLVTDGTAIIYVVDVDIGQKDYLRNVPVARGSNRNLILADSGAAVNLARDASGGWEVTGFSSELPGTYTSFSVDLGTFEFGAVTDHTLAGRSLTYGELSVYGSYGTIPYGSVGLFVGGVFQELKP